MHRPNLGLLGGSRRFWPLIVLIQCCLVISSTAQNTSTTTPLEKAPVIRLNDAGTPPDWALMQQQLMKALYPAAMAFIEKYTHEDGTLKWREEWPGMDGSDDGYEAFYNFPLYYALGGPKPIDSLSRIFWDAITEQFTKYGQVHDEFDAGYDWMHHGESYTYFYFFGLADPTDKKMRDRAIKFAEMYMDDGTEKSNYDDEHKIIRSPLTGSLGPRFVNTAEDWVTHRPILAHYPLPYDDIPNVDSSSAWNDDQKFPYILQAINERMMKNDVPLNLASTSLMANAYMYTQDEKYKNWVTEYVEAWMQRVEDNSGVIPDNVGHSGEIGENTGGKWWGGYYGWRWPHGLPNQMEATTIGASNAYLLTGDSSYLELPYSVIRAVSVQAKVEDGLTLVPYRYDDRGWYDYRPMRPKYPTHLWYYSRTQEDWERVKTLTDSTKWQRLQYRKSKGDSENTAAWLGYLEGVNPTYPMDILHATYQEMQRRLEVIWEDDSTPDDQDVHHWLERNPVVLEGLVQTMLGAPNHIYHGGLLHSSLRYFDPDNERPGIPEDVAALVRQVNPGGVSLQLVNLHPTETKRVVVQGGMFGEHQITRVRQVIHYPYQFNTIDHKYMTVELAPGAVGQIEIGLNRFANDPSYVFPWHGNEVPVVGMK
ncbi:MAG: hypothetical protein ACFB15_14305 [Cyclobacteriaceae bacterium]